MARENTEAVESTAVAAHDMEDLATQLHQTVSRSGSDAKSRKTDGLGRPFIQASPAARNQADARALDQGLDLADDATPEGQHTDDEDQAHDHRHPGADLVGQFVLQGDDGGRSDCRAENGAQPPSSVISTTSPDMCQWTSERDVSWNTRVLVAPARPASDAEITKAISLNLFTS
jgi:hypothetical protein